MTKLNYAEYEVVYELRINQGFGPGTIFNPVEAFPNRDNHDNACRRTVDRLVTKGLVDKFKYGNGNGYALTEEAVRAMAEYQKELDRKRFLATVQKYGLADDDDWDDWD